jgi:2-dehydropantoate 2-reductase
MELVIGVMGAGAIGLYVGGLLAARGQDVRFVGRGRMKAELEAAGLTLTDLDDKRAVVPKERVVCATELSSLAACNVILVCVKSGQTAEVAAQLKGVLAPDTLVVSLQNGLGNAEVLRAHLPAARVLAGIVGFNVVWRGPGTLKRTTTGPLVIEASDDPRAGALAAALAACGFPLEHPVDIRPLQWTKLLMNLNNAVSALTGAPTQDLIFVRGYRRILAAVIKESLAILRAAGIRPAKLGSPIPVRLFPLMLRLPSALLRVAARAQIKIDPEARSSMWDDLSKGRLTEIDYLNGEIVRLAEARGLDAPLNRRMVELVHAAEQKAAGSPNLAADVLWRALQAGSL